MGDPTPTVGRPRGAAWRALKADGIIWEGQVVIVGDNLDLLARLIVTRQRLALSRGGDLALEVPRQWLRPVPILRPDGTIALTVSPPDGGEVTIVALAVRDGRHVAAHLVSLLAGSGVRPVAPDPIIDVASAPSGGFGRRARREPVAEAEPIVLPPLPDRWPWDDEPPPPPPPAKSVPSLQLATEQIHRAPGPPISVSRDRDWNLRPIPGMVPPLARGRKRGWMVRLLGLFALLAVAAYVGADHLPPAVTERYDAGLPALIGGDDEQPTAPPPTATGAALATATTPPDRAARQGTEPAAIVDVPTEEAPDDLSIGGPSLSPTPSLPAPAPTSTPTPTATPSPVTTPATATPTVPPSTATPPTAQPPSVDSGEAPDQVVVDGPFRFTVEAAVRGADLTAYGLPVLDFGDWVILVVHARNWSGEQAILDITRFELGASGPAGGTVGLDVASGEVASLLGFVPAYRSTQAVPFSPSEGHRLALVFAISPEAADLTLVTGASRLGLDEALVHSVPITDLRDLGDPPAPPNLIPARVIQVIDGRSIVVDIDGLPTTVRYVGVNTPASDQCWAAEATAANATLVEGQTVWLERERSDIDSSGRLVRDVWLLDGTGAYVHVAGRLVADGAALPLASAPDMRYAGWLRAASANAQYQGVGLWGVCGTGSEALAPGVESMEQRIVPAL